MISSLDASLSPEPRLIYPMAYLICLPTWMSDMHLKLNMAKSVKIILTQTQFPSHFFICSIQ